MTGWILIIFIHAGARHADPVALTSVPGFVTEEVCKKAGERSKNLISGTKKGYAFSCVKSNLSFKE